MQLGPYMISIPETLATLFIVPVVPALGESMAETGGYPLILWGCWVSHH